MFNKVNHFLSISGGIEYKKLFVTESVCSQQPTQ